MKEKVYTQEWVELPHEFRVKLAAVFGITKTGISEVRDQTLISDGTTMDDLKVITKEAMAEYTGSDPEDSFSHLWEVTLSKVKYELHPPTIEIGVGPVEELKEVTEESNAKTTTKKSK